MLIDLIPRAAEAIGWKADRLTPGCFGVQTGRSSVPIMFLRAVPGSPACLDTCLPLATHVEDDAIRKIARANGAGEMAAGAAWFSDYEGADGGRYLGAFVRVPIPQLFEAERPLGEMLFASLAFLAYASMMFERYVEYCRGHGEPAGCEPLVGRDVVSARPADSSRDNAATSATIAPSGSGQVRVGDAYLIDVFNDGAGEGLVVIPEREARRLAALNDALEGSSSWGEFLSKVTDDQESKRYLEDQYAGELPDPDEPFDADTIPGFADGDWPTWPKQAMLDWLPASVKALGTIGQTAINGPVLQLDESLRDTVLEALAAEGIECREDEDGLVITACGAWRYA